MNARDFNGHTPEDQAPPANPCGPDECDPPAMAPAELCACCLRDDPAYQLGYREGYEQALLKVCIALLEQANADATAIRERLERIAA